MGIGDRHRKRARSLILADSSTALGEHSYGLRMPRPAADGVSQRPGRLVVTVSSDLAYEREPRLPLLIGCSEKTDDLRCLSKV
ncbi:hypothetical protein SAMN05428944_0190 [Streptomyces sp. 1222.5]|nr:hypothetical protein SAMN05428944_0190 [Streptomyces sp. 1222.5]